MKLSMTVRVFAGVWNNISLPLLGAGRRVDVFMAVVVLGLNVGTIFRTHLFGGARYCLPFRGVGRGRVTAVSEVGLDVGAVLAIGVEDARY